MPELLVILVIVLIVFGAGKISEIGGALGRGISEFRKNSEPEAKKDAPAAEVDASGPTVIS